MTGAEGTNGNHVFRPRSLRWHDFYINLKDGDDSIENMGMGIFCLGIQWFAPQHGDGGGNQDDYGEDHDRDDKNWPVTAYPTVNHRQYVTTVPQVRHT